MLAHWINVLIPVTLIVMALRTGLEFAVTELWFRRLFRRREQSAAF